MLKKVFSFTSIPAIALATLVALNSLHADVLINQVGYYTNLPKVLIATDADSKSYTLHNAEDGKEVFHGKLSKTEYDADAGMKVRMGNFGKFNKSGNYYVQLADGTRSPTFAIADTVLKNALNASLKSFYLNRSSTEIPEKFGGVYARELGHPDITVKFHPSTGRKGFAASPKGWYDAGDYGKYIVNGGFATSILLSLYELLPESIGDNLNIPESGNGISDLLDECRWELDWFLTMQDEDGGVFHKLTTVHFVGTEMPKDSTLQRYFIGKGTGATLNFTATLAQAARIWKDIDPAFSQRCLEAAEAAWQWAVKHPDQLFNNPEGISTGNYGQDEVDDEFDWAAAQLFITTGDESYLETLQDLFANPEIETAAGWGNTRNLGLFSLATVDSKLDTDTRTALRKAILKSANGILQIIEENPARSPLKTNDYHWGSNGVAASRGMTLAYAYDISPRKSYLQGMTEIADYLLGRNVTSYSFLTGFGSKQAMNIHHRPSAADDVVAPFPGFVVGGPNQGRQDHQDYTSEFPAQAYVDHYKSFASNEIAINWNAPFVFLLGALEQADKE